MFKCSGLVLITSLCFCAFSARASDPIQPTATAETNSNEALMAQLVALRDSFIKAVRAEGFRPRLAPPTILLDNPPSYGDYEDSKNILHIAVWSALDEKQQSRFDRLSKVLNEGKSGEQSFDESVHHWVFVHELGHWWQACQHKISNNHYAVEYGANRIAAAFWRHTDPDLMRHTENRMATVIKTLQNPVRAGQPEVAYFNENYEKLGPTPAYIWFQYTMVLKVQAEHPLPSLKQTLSQPVFLEHYAN